MGDATEYTFNTSGMALGERYGMRVGAKPVGCPESDAVWTEVGIMLPAPTPTPSPVPTPVPLSGEGWTRDGQPLDAERAFEVREERVQLGVQVEGEVESVDFTLTDSTGKPVSGVLETDEPDVENGSYPVTINRRAMVRGQVYTINADIAARNPETGDKALTLDITAPKSWTWLWIVCGVALLLIAGLVLALILAKKKREKDKTAVVPGGGEEEDPYEKTNVGPVQRPEDRMVAPTRGRLTYRQEMDDEPPTQQIQVVAGTAVIGRDENCSIYFNGGTRAERTVSHKHARLTVDQEGGMYIEPFPGTRNPTIVDGRAIDGPTQLFPGTVIKMGDITWTVISVEKVHKN